MLLTNLPAASKLWVTMMYHDDAGDVVAFKRCSTTVIRPFGCQCRQGQVHRSQHDMLSGRNDNHFSPFNVDECCMLGGCGRQGIFHKNVSASRKLLSCMPRQTQLPCPNHPELSVSSFMLCEIGSLMPLLGMSRSVPSTPAVQLTHRHRQQ